MKPQCVPLPNIGQIQRSTNFSRPSSFVGNFEQRKSMPRKIRDGGGVILDHVVQNEKFPPIEYWPQVKVELQFLQLVWLLLFDKCSVECRNRQNNTLTARPYHSVSQHHAGVKIGGWGARWRAQTTVGHCRENLQSLMRCSVQQETEGCFRSISYFLHTTKKIDLFLRLSNAKWNNRSIAVLWVSADRMRNSSLKGADGELKGVRIFDWNERVWKTVET